MRADRLQMAVNEKKAHNEDDFEDLQYINESSKEQLELDKMRRECQQNTLALQMQAIEEGKRSASAMKIQELRQAKLYQAQLNEQLDQQEQKRRDQRATVQKKVQAGEARAMRQYAMVEGAVSADEKKARWLQQRLDRDVEQLDRQAEVRASTQQARKKKANSEMLTVLQKQIFHRQHQKLLEKHQSAELAQEIQNGLDLMIMHDELHQQNTEEKQEWLHADAQRKVKSFKETKIGNMHSSNGCAHKVHFIVQASPTAVQLPFGRSFFSGSLQISFSSSDNKIISYSTVSYLAFPLLSSSDVVVLLDFRCFMKCFLQRRTFFWPFSTLKVFCATQQNSQFLNVSLRV